jgi:hypothetical protein
MRDVEYLTTAGGSGRGGGGAPGLFHMRIKDSEETNVTVFGIKTQLSAFPDFKKLESSLVCSVFGQFTFRNLEAKTTGVTPHLPISKVCNPCNDFVNNVFRSKQLHISS